MFKRILVKWTMLSSTLFLLGVTGHLQAADNTTQSQNNNTQTKTNTGQATTKKPNILVIMGDDIGWFNIGAYHQGIMSGKTPNIDKLAAQGMRFTDYYAEASCTAGRANFITGELPIRTGLTTVGQAGADVGIPAEASTIASALKELGYVTGQFGKNHLGDLNKYLPTLHGFDEFHGYLYHLDAMSDPYWYSYPKDPAFRAKYGPRNVLHTWATDTENETVEPRWGKIGKQRIVDDGPLPPNPVEGVKYDMETFDDVLLADVLGFIEKANKDGKPFFVWHNPTRMHVWTHLAEKYRKLMNSETNYGIEEAGMVQLDDIVGTLLSKLDELGIADNTIVIFTTDNGAEVLTWPDGGMTPFRMQKGTVYEGGFRVPAIIRWPGKVKAGTVENAIFSGLDWYPTLVAAAGDPDITNKLLKGVKLGDRTYKNHLDGYNQMDLLTGKGESKRREIFYFGGAELGAVRLNNFKYQFYDQPEGWPGPKVMLDMPVLYNLRQDPFERTVVQNWGIGSGDYMSGFFAREFWRFVLVQDVVAKLGETAVEFPPMQDPASFNLTEVKRKIDEKIKEVQGQ